MISRDAAWSDEPLDFGHLAAGYGLRTATATRDWALWALERLDRAAQR